MLHKAWNSKGEMPYCFPRSSIKFQGHTVQNITDFDPNWAFPDYRPVAAFKSLRFALFYPNWAFPDCKSSLNSPMAMKCCTKLETAKERCPIVFQGDPSNFKVTRYKTSPILTQIGHFRTIGRSQLSNPSDLPCCSQITFCVEINLTKKTCVYKEKPCFELWKNDLSKCMVVCAWRPHDALVIGGRLSLVNSSWPGDDMWWHRFESTLAQVMVWCLTAPNHYLSQWWLINIGLYGIHIRGISQEILIPCCKMSPKITFLK